MGCVLRPDVQTDDLRKPIATVLGDLRLEVSHTNNIALHLWICAYGHAVLLP